MSKKARIVGMDGTEIYISDGGCLGDSTSRFVFASTVTKACSRWNKKYKDAYISEEQLARLARDSSHNRIANFKIIEGEEW